MVPGMRVPFAIMGTVAGAAAVQGWRKQGLPDEPEEDLSLLPRGDDEVPVETLLRVEPIAIELGVDLISLVDERKGGNLVERIQRIRRQVAQDLGLLVPSVHLRDNLRLEGGEYQVLLRGERVAYGKVYARQFLAIDPGDAKGPLRGIKTQDPVFGLDGHWIPDSQRMAAQAAGYTVVDVATVITTHLTEVVNQYGYELFGRQQLAAVLDRVADANPRLVEELLPDPLSRPRCSRSSATCCGRASASEMPRPCWRRSATMLRASRTPTC